MTRVQVAERPGQTLWWNDTDADASDRRGWIQDSHGGKFESVVYQAALARGYWRRPGDIEQAASAADDEFFLPTDLQQAEDKAAPPMLVKEARCPTCRHLEARNVNAGAELNCRKCRRNFLVERS